MENFLKYNLCIYLCTQYIKYYVLNQIYNILYFIIIFILYLANINGSWQSNYLNIHSEKHYDSSGHTSYLLDLKIN